MPYGAACVASYAKKYASFQLEIHMVKFPEEVFGICNSVSPSMVCFSSYAWNTHLSCSFAREIKKNRPDTIIVFGGPNFSSEAVVQEEFLRSEPAIDFFLEGEGEEAFLEFVERAYDCGFSKACLYMQELPNARYLVDNVFKRNHLLPRMKDLDRIPSPYLDGILDRFFEKGCLPRTQTIRGCPFGCTYCVEGHKYYNQISRHRSEQSFREEIEYIASRSKRNRQLNIADSNYGMYRKDLETAAVLRDVYRETGYPEYIHVAMGKTQKNRVAEVADILEGRLRLSGSVQSMNPVVLKNIKRKNVSLDELKELARKSKTSRTNSYSEIIIPLPGETREAFEKYLEPLLDADFNILMVYTLMLLDGAEISTGKSMKKFGLESGFRVLPRCFGKYQFGDSMFVSAEVEKVCVGHKDMTFSEYIHCRILSLIIMIFYNDRLFEEITLVLRGNNIPVANWILEICEKLTSIKNDTGLGKLIQDFQKETRDEIWRERDQLRRSLLDPLQIEKYIRGELGRNLLYTYKADAILNHIDGLIAAGIQAAKKLVLENHQSLSEEHQIRMERFFEDLAALIAVRKSNLFNVKENYKISLRFNLEPLIEGIPMGKEKIAEAERPTIYHLFNSEEQQKVIEEQQAIYGKDLHGAARVLARVNVSRLFRNVQVIRTESASKHVAG
jgi:radical SAM superfamily enzyme YgiQ (UPF0313 family)